MPPRRIGNPSNAHRETSQDVSIAFEVDGQECMAKPGESVAMALTAAGRLVISRSLKYHRPRGASCLTGECSGCRMRIDGMPNTPACLTTAKQGMKVETQNTWGSANFDLLNATDFVFAQGFDHQRFMTSPSWVNQAMQKVARHIAGSGTLPIADEAKSLDVKPIVRASVCVVGAGEKGTHAVQSLLQAGFDLLWVAEGAIRDLEDYEPHRLLAYPNTSVVAAYPREHGHRLLLVPRDSEGVVEVLAKHVVLATGMRDVPMGLVNEDLPGVFQRGAIERLLNARICPGDHGVWIASNDESLESREIAAHLRLHCKDLTQVLASQLDSFEGSTQVASVLLKDGRRLACDFAVVDGEHVPRYELAQELGLSLTFSEDGPAWKTASAQNTNTSVHVLHGKKSARIETLIDTLRGAS